MEYVDDAGDGLFGDGGQERRHPEVATEEAEDVEGRVAQIRRDVVLGVGCSENSSFPQTSRYSLQSIVLRPPVRSFGLSPRLQFLLSKGIDKIGGDQLKVELVTGRFQKRRRGLLVSNGFEEVEVLEVEDGELVGDGAEGEGLVLQKHLQLEHPLEMVPGGG